MRMRGMQIWTCWFRRELFGSARLLHESQVCGPDVMVLSGVGDLAPERPEPVDGVQNDRRIGVSDDAIWKEIDVSSTWT
jgi:hypothetical protein